MKVLATIVIMVLLVPIGILTAIIEFIDNLFGLDFGEPDEVELEETIYVNEDEDEDIYV